MFPEQTSTFFQALVSFRAK